MRASLLGAREFYERLVHADAAARANGETPAWRFVPVSALPPDTNIVCFLVQRNTPAGLKDTNALNRRIYEAFTIGAHGDSRIYSYSQPFFLSRTVFTPSKGYSATAIGSIPGSARALMPANIAHRENLFVLRATIMSPYHVLAAESGHRQALLAEFVECIASTASAAVPA